MIQGPVLIKIGKKIAEVTETQFDNVHRFNDDYIFNFLYINDVYTIKLHKNYDYIKFEYLEYGKGFSKYENTYEIEDKTIKGFIKLAKMFVMEVKLGRV
jgi:hypothetical protein